MTVQRFEEYENDFSLRIQVNGCEESTILVRLLLQGRLEGVRVHGSFSKKDNAVLCIDIPKAKNRQYNSLIALGAKKIT